MTGWTDRTRPPRVSSIILLMTLATLGLLLLTRGALRLVDSLFPLLVAA